MTAPLESDQPTAELFFTDKTTAKELEDQINLLKLKFSPEQLCHDVATWKNSMGRNYLMIAARLDLRAGCFQILVELFRNAGGTYLLDALVKPDKHARNCLMIASSTDTNPKSMQVLLDAYHSCRGSGTTDLAFEAVDIWKYNALIIGLRGRLNVKSLRLLVRAYARRKILKTSLLQLDDAQIADVLTIISPDVLKLVASQLEDQDEVEELFAKAGISEKPQDKHQQSKSERVLDPDEMNHQSLLRDPNSWMKSYKWYTSQFRWFGTDDAVQERLLVSEVKDFIELKVKPNFTSKSTPKDVCKFLSDCFAQVEVVNASKPFLLDLPVLTTIKTGDSTLTLYFYCHVLIVRRT